MNKEGEVDIAALEKSAKQNALNFGTPDISGGIKVDGDFVYFLDKFGFTSVYMHVDAFNEFRKQLKEHKNDTVCNN